MSFRGKSNESKPGEESSHSREISSVSTIQQNVPEGSDLTGRTTEEEEEEEKQETTEQLTLKDKLSEGESVSRELDTDEPSGEVEQDPLGVLDSDHENVIDRADVDPPDSEFTGVALGFSDDAACVPSPTAAEDDRSEKEGVLDKNMIDSKGKTEPEEQAEVFSPSGCPGSNVCEAKFEEKGNAKEGSAAKGDRQEEEDEKPQHEDAGLGLLESLKSEYERPEDSKRQVEDQAETTEELERLRTCSEERHDRFSTIEDRKVVVYSKADSVEVSFEDLPEAQGIKEFGDSQPEEQDAAGVSQTDMEMLPVEESKETAAVAPDQNVSVTQEHEHEMVGVEKEANSEMKEMKSQQEVSVMREGVDTNDPNLFDEEDEMGEGDEVVSSSDQPAGTPESDNPEYEHGHAHESSLKRSEVESQQKDPNCEEAETTDVQKADEEHGSKQGLGDGGAENPLPQASLSNLLPGPPETETKTLETSVHRVSEEDNRGQGTALMAEPEVAVLEEEPSEPLELVEEQTRDPDTQEDSPTSVKDSASPHPPADEGEKGHLEKDTAGPEDGSGEKVPCVHCLSKENSQRSWE